MNVLTGVKFGSHCCGKPTRRGRSAVQLGALL